MFTAQDDAGLGLPVVHEPYPDGEEGIQKSLAAMCVKIREGAPTAAMKSFAGNMMKDAGFPDGALAQGQAVLDNIRARAMYAPDALGTEQIQSAMITWCVPGAPICIPIYDCDDGVVAVATAMAALGHEVEVVRQKFGYGHQQHVICEVRGENGEWIPLDPSHKTMPAGKKVKAVSETRHSPFDGQESVGARFVGIGALPFLIWKKEKWERVGVGAATAHLYGTCCESCAQGKTCDRESCDTDKRMQVQPQPQGFGAPWPSLTSMLPQIAWIKAAWPAFDASGRSWDATLSSAYSRGASRQWIPNDPISRSDLIAVIIATSMSARAVSSMPDQGQRAANDLNRTWEIIAKKIGYTPDLTLDKLKARVQSEQNPTTAAATIAIFELLAIIVAIAAQVVIACFAIYYAYKIVDALLARIVAFAELIWLEIQVQKIIERHLSDPTLPWTDEEKQHLAQLEQMQGKASAAVSAPPSSDITPPDTGTPAWVWIGGAVVVTGGVLAIVYRDQIKRWLDRPSKKLSHASERRRRLRRAA